MTELASVRGQEWKGEARESGDGHAYSIEKVWNDARGEATRSQKLK